MKEYDPIVLFNGCHCWLMSDINKLEVWHENIRVSADATDIAIYFIDDRTSLGSPYYLLNAGELSLSLTEDESKIIAAAYHIEVEDCIITDSDTVH